MLLVVLLFVATVSRPGGIPRYMNTYMYMYIIYVHTHVNTAGFSFFEMRVQGFWLDLGTFQMMGKPGLEALTGDLSLQSP